MSPKLRVRLCAALSGLLALACVWAFFDSRQEIPTQALQRAEGTVAWTEARSNKGRVRGLRFALVGQDRVHEYSEGLPMNEVVIAQLRRGSRVQLEHGPDGSHDIWAFSMDGRQVLLPEQRLAGQRRVGWLALAFAGVCAGLALWLWRYPVKVRAVRV